MMNLVILLRFQDKMGVEPPCFGVHGQLPYPQSSSLKLICSHTLMLICCAGAKHTLKAKEITQNRKVLHQLGVLKCRNDHGLTFLFLTTPKRTQPVLNFFKRKYARNPHCELQLNVDLKEKEKNAGCCMLVDGHLQTPDAHSTVKMNRKY